MREIRTSGSEGGGAGCSTGPPYPYQGGRREVVRERDGTRARFHSPLPEVREGGSLSPGTGERAGERGEGSIGAGVRAAYASNCRST